MTHMAKVCPDPERLAAWVENPQGEPEVMAHLASCDDCRRAAVIAGGLDEPTGRKLDEALLERVVSAARRRPVWPWVAAAAAAAIVAALILPATPTPDEVSRDETVLTPPTPEPDTIDPVLARDTPPEVVVPTPEKDPVEAPTVRVETPPAPEKKEEKPPAVEDVVPSNLVKHPTPDPEKTPVVEDPKEPVVIESTPSLVSVFLVDAEGEPWLQRGEEKPVRFTVLERLAVGDIISTRNKAGAIRIEGRASLVLDKGTRAQVSYNEESSAFRLTLERGKAIIDTEGKPQLWEILGAGGETMLSQIHGRLAVEHRKGGLAALFLDGRG